MSDGADPFSGLSRRARRALSSLKCRNFEEASRLSRRDLHRIPNCGEETIREIVEELRSRGLSLATPVTDRSPAVAAELTERRSRLLRELEDIDRRLAEFPAPRDGLDKRPVDRNGAGS